MRTEPHKGLFVVNSPTIPKGGEKSRARPSNSFQYYSARASYKKEELIGKQVVVVDNLEPAFLRGVESQGMILAASDETGITIVSPEKKMKLASIVK